MTFTQDPTRQKLTFRDFLEKLPDEEGDYELVDGKIVRKLPTRRHETIAEYIADELKAEIHRLSLNYWVSGRVVIRTITEDGTEQGRHPDITVVDKQLWESQPMAYSALLEPPQMVIEVVSTNWEDDYVDKLDEYRRLGIPEYWIVDYMAIASRSYLGKPKEPTVFVCSLDDNGTYQMTPYRESDRIVSPTFPELAVSVESILNS
ncbi:MAG: Uma2 family endonuclease [Cyanobacteria bacterium SBC]|nr:Uma2 family endonuclease [Cyanobacteria bacterium SBC]